MSNPYGDAPHPNFNPYQPPGMKPPAGYLPPGVKPPVHVWYGVYCIAMACLYALLALVFGIGFVFAEALAAEVDEDAIAIRIQCAVFAVMFLPLAVAFAAGPFLPPKPWAWVVGIIQIALGLTSICTLLPCIFLLIAWLKPETKAYFGKA